MTTSNWRGNELSPASILRHPGYYRADAISHGTRQRFRPPMPQSGHITGYTEESPCGPRREDEDLFISSLTVAEIRRGILEKLAGKKHRELERWFSGPGWTMARFAQGSVTSRDGTRIGYRQIGHGPAVVLLHGGMQAAQDFTLLAESLSSSFSVYVPDRRGRGLSPAATCANLAQQCEDLEALLLESGAHRVFGLSSGAIVAIYGALGIPAIQKVAVYEPPVSIHGGPPVTGRPPRRRAILFTVVLA